MLLFFAICHVPVLLFKSLYHHRRWLMSGITVYTSRTQLRAILTFLLLVILNNSGSPPATIIPAKLFVGKKNWPVFATPWVCFNLLRNCPQLSVCISPLVNCVHLAQHWGPCMTFSETGLWEMTTGRLWIFTEKIVDCIWERFCSSIGLQTEFQHPYLQHQCVLT